MKAKRRAQKRIPGTRRDPLPACVVHEIRARVERLALRFNCSRSFVVATLLADALEIRLGERYDE